MSAKPGSPRHALIKLLTALTLTTLLAACGGGGGGGDGGAGTPPAPPAPPPPPAATAPTISSQPTNVSVMAGQSANFSVTATGTAPLAYSWQRNGVVIAGANAATYTLAAAALADSGAQFLVVVSNAQGQVTSAAATLTVTPTPMPPTVSSQPANATAVAGQTATFSVVATGSATLAYQWQRNAVDIAGANAASYTTPALVVADSGSLYRVVVTNSAGTVTSDAATLTVTPAPMAPTIGTQPQAQRVIVGQTASFSVVASGTAPLAYQWRRNGTAIAGATAASYTTAVTTLADNGASFDVQVSNSAGNLTSDAVVLTVEAPVPADYWLRANAGLSQSGTVVFANTSPAAPIAATAFNLTLVDPTRPGSPNVAEAGGGYLLQAVATEPRFNPQNAGDFSERYVVYARGTRLWRLDLLNTTPNSAPPTPTQLGSVSLNELCPILAGGSAATPQFFGDNTNAAASVVHYRAPGADNLCNTADDGFVALRLDATASTAPTAVPRLLTAVRNSSGAITGFLARQGNTVQRLDTSFGSATTLFSTGAADLQFLRLPGAEGLVVFRDGDAVRAIDPSSTAAPVDVLTAAADFLQLGEIGGPQPTAIYRNNNRVWTYSLGGTQPLREVLTLTAGQSVTRGGGDTEQSLLIVASNDGSSRVVSLKPDGTVTTLFTESTVVDTGNVGITPSRYIYTTGGNTLRSVLRTGGTPITLAQGTQLRVQNIGSWPHETVSYDVRGAGGALFGTEARSISSDGSNPQVLNNSITVGGASFNGFGDSSVGRIVAQGLSSDPARAYSGASLAALDAATGAVRTTYGDLGVAGYNSIDVSRVSGPDRPVLIFASRLATSVNESSSIDLYLLRVGQPGLTRLTSFVP